MKTDPHHLRTAMRAALAAALAISIGLVGAAPARADSPPDRGSAFEPHERSKPLYGTKPPSADPAHQQHYVQAADGTDLYVETWLPAPKNGRTPPKRIPTIVVMTPYVPQGEQEYTFEEPYLVDYFTARGYAVAQAHVRGNQESGGCMEQTGPKMIDGNARVIEYLGRDAPWTNGKVGAYGISYDAETQVSVAGLGDPERTKYLKAIVPVSSMGGAYDIDYLDGVPSLTEFVADSSYYWAASLVPGNTVSPRHEVDRVPCGPEQIAVGLNPNGNYGPFWRARQFRPGAPRTKAAVLYVHGLRDFNVLPITLAGWFSALPPTTPHKGVFPVSDHAFPSDHAGVEPDWERTDWSEMVGAWYDRYLKDLHTGVEDWPAVQVQDNLGQWRAVDEFPFTGGPAGQLALGPGGTLGTRSPTGSTTYAELLPPGEVIVIPGTNAVFETPPLTAPLHLTGMPILDLWVSIDRPDGHIAAALEVIGPDGRVMQHETDSPGPAHLLQKTAATFGARSLQHLEPMTRGWFEQEQPVLPPTDEPLHVNVRLLPTDLVVPKGGSLRLTIAGSVSFDGTIATRKTLPSGTDTIVTILHDCAHPSFLRFLMPDPNERLLNVREKDEGDGRLSSRPGRIGRGDGAGLATAAVCGRGPVKVSLLRDGIEEGPGP